MRYQGGKTRIAKDISRVIIEYSSGGQDTLVSLFCGACSVETKFTERFKNVICNDSHEYLIALWQGVQRGYELPDTVSEEEWRYRKNHKDEDKVLTGFIGFACSFGGRFFEGYARSHKAKRNFALGGKKSIVKDIEYLKKLQFSCLDYRDVKLPDGCIVYADPPYNGTKQYGNKVFNSAEFWNYADEVSKTHMMFISELNAPDDYIPIWSKSVTRTLDRNKDNQFKAIEKLFLHKRWVTNID